MALLKGVFLIMNDNCNFLIKIKGRIFLLLIQVLISLPAIAQKIGTFQKSFGSTGEDDAASVIALPDKGFILSGITKSYGAGGYDILLMRTDSLGKQIWSKTYGGSSDDGYFFANIPYNVDIILTPDTNILVCTNTKSFGAGGADVYLLKVDLTGKWKVTKSVDFTSNY